MLLYGQLLSLCSLSLNCCDSDCAYDVIGIAASGKIVDGKCETLEDRSVSGSLCKSLNELVADVACFE